MKDLLKVLEIQKTKNKSSIKFPVFKNSEALKTSVKELNINLNYRSRLLKNKFFTIGDIIQFEFDIKYELGLPTDYIYSHVCCCYYSKLDEEEKKEFLKELMKINKIQKS